MNLLKASLLPLAILLTGAAVHAEEINPPPRDLATAWKLSPFYAKYLEVGGMPVLGSAKVSGYAIAEAGYLIRQMVGQRPEILRALAANHVRFVVMAPGEMTTDVPEHSDLEPRAYWDRRARGLGATPERPAVSCGEENLLELPGDPYRDENILIHEFAHAIHERAMTEVDPTFDQRLRAAFAHAKAAGLWKGTYAMQLHTEYWAEAAQSWFDCNRANDNEHGPIDTREKLKAYDPEIAALLTEVFGDRPWRYAKPSKRAPEENRHLAGFDVSEAGSFHWPDRAPDPSTQGDLLSWLEPAERPSASPRADAKATTVVFVNRRGQPVTIDWLDFDGKRRHYSDLRPGMTHLQNTFAGHVWVVSEGKDEVGVVAAREIAGRVEIR